MKEIFTYKFLFEVNRIMLEKSDKVFLMIGALLVVLAIVFKIAAKLAPSEVDSKYRNKLFSLFLYIGFAEVIWFGLRYQNIKFFGSHFVAMLVLLIGLVWFVYLLVRMFKNYGQEKIVWEKEQVRQKYLPQ
jgi:Ca2+/Na+ antiporter